ncbi:hypothetical protein [Arthrobacter sp. M4]|uniref:hypothetical protein n=1 Tax=Arthrobacter sp. M4 TaxID=218160 RepID=UPI001CDB513A|nr:hypothetical protein [Arthrobacter sp. M4]MCA4134903.1 hypothetical protein [Arthrobacter sp. M4]
MAFRDHLNCILAIGMLAFVTPTIAACSDNTNGPERVYIANNFGELIEESLSGPFLQEFDRGVLERAKVAGRIEQADYDEAYSRFEQCMRAVDEPVTLKKLSNGLYKVETTPLSPGESLDSAMDKVTECSKGTTFHIAGLYGIQQGNPKLLANPDQVAYECLEAKGLVSSDFSLEEFTEAMTKPGNPGQSTQDRVPFDLYEDEAQACLVGANMSYSKG